ncbi:GerAB/ArcD/ProY family transporter [Desulfosporosinus burensis]
MLEKGRISSQQFFFLILVLILSASLFNLPSIIISRTKQDVWIVMLIALGIDAVVAVVLYVLGLRYPNQTMFEYSEEILGRFLGKGVGLIFALFFLLTTAVDLQITISLLTTAVMPETPQTVFYLIMLIVAAYAVNAGLEPIGRLSELVGPLVVFSLLLSLALNINHIKLENLKPVFQLSMREDLQNSLLPGSLFGVCIIMGVFMAYHNNPKDTLKAKLGGVVTGTLLIILNLLVVIMVFGANMCAELRFPLYSLAQMIEIGDFFERLELLVMIFWIAAGFISISMLYYASTLGFAQLLKLPDYKPLTPLIGVAVFILTMTLFRNITDTDALFESSIFTYLALSVEGGLTTLLFFVSLLRHRKKPIWIKKRG